MTWDLSHWRTLPKVSCQCITYGRTNLLDEAVECFLRQDYPGEKELVILNDLPTMKLAFDHPEVVVVNLPRRMRTVGEKRNACVALCGGDIIFPWDDDDISLPHRISFTLSRMTNHDYWKPDRYWYWRNGQINPEPTLGVAHAMGAWSRALFDAVSGYPHMESGQDQAIENLFARQGDLRCVQSIARDEIFYVYRFPGTGSYHLSSGGYGKGMASVAAHVERAKPPAEHAIRPHWEQDYPELIRGILNDREPVQPVHVCH